VSQQISDVDKSWRSRRPVTSILGRRPGWSSNEQQNDEAAQNGESHQEFIRADIRNTQEGDVCNKNATRRIEHFWGKATVSVAAGTTVLTRVS
jgi:hypothetical protein